MIKEDEIQLVKAILKYCKNPYDLIPHEEITNLKIHVKRLNYLLNKMSHFIEYGVNIFYGWICEDTSCADFAR